MDSNPFSIPMSNPRANAASSVLMSDLTPANGSPGYACKEQNETDTAAEAIRYLNIFNSYSIL
jgi:hypothetical protein